MAATGHGHLIVTADESKYSLKKIIDGQIHHFRGEHGLLNALASANASIDETIVCSAAAMAGGIAKKLSPNQLKNSMNEYVWSTSTEILVGIDAQGKYFDNQPVVMILNQCGILSYDRVSAALNGESTPYMKARLQAHEWNRVLNSKMPITNLKFPIYTLDKLSQIEEPEFSRYAVILSLEEAAKACGEFGREDFMKNPLARAIFVSQSSMGGYFDIANHKGKIMINSQLLAADPNQPSASFVYLLKGAYGLSAPGLRSDGRFLTISKEGN